MMRGLLGFCFLIKLEDDGALQPLFVFYFENVFV
jgi:hypothetical protein